jgi:hypothetical protein
MAPIVSRDSGGSGCFRFTGVTSISGVGRHSTSSPKTVGELVAALSQIDPSLPVVEAWDGIPGWFEVDEDGKRVTIGVFLDSCYADLSDFQSNVTSMSEAEWIGERGVLREMFGGLELPEGYDRRSWPYGD